MDQFVRELFHMGVYKRNQGRVTRQVTFAVLAVTCALGAWRLAIALEGATFGPLVSLDAQIGADGALVGSLRYAIPLFIAVAGMWISFRVVNLPRFADFLIAVEAEMTKVSWPDRKQLFRSSMVVMFTIFFLAAVLFVYDIVWRTLLEFLGIVN